MFSELEFDSFSSQITSVPQRWERKAASHADRFIPNRPTGAENIPSNINTDDVKSSFVADELNSKILSYKQKAPKPSESSINHLKVLYEQNQVKEVKKTNRYIASAPEKVLDAPNLVDDYYLHLLDYSSTNQIAIALGDAVYLYNANTNTIDELCHKENDVITSVSFMQDGSHIAIGTASAEVQLWNVDRKKQVRSMKGHQARVGTLAWNNHILSSGSRDSMIFHHDVRIAQHHFATIKAHTQEVCGLKWSHDGSQLASGGNDNLVSVFDGVNTTSKYTFTDATAAVRALAWCPWQSNTLATGAGTADRHIRFYNTTSGSLLNSIQTNSQVCSLVWSKTEKEILSSHGFDQNQLSVWKYPTMAKVADLTSHSNRVLHTAISPDGQTVVSAAADETLCFWKVWEPVQPRKKSSSLATSGLSTLIR